jgi:regulator of replication initiation timing
MLFKTKKRLQNQVEALQNENEDLNSEAKNMRSQRDALVDENKKLRVQIADIRDEANKAMEAKEAERQELSDKIGELEQQAEKDKDLIGRQSNTIGRIIKENALLIKTNANLAQKLNLHRDNKGRFARKQQEDK